VRGWEIHVFIGKLKRHRSILGKQSVLRKSGSLRRSMDLKTRERYGKQNLFLEILEVKLELSRQG